MVQQKEAAAKGLSTPASGDRQPSGGKRTASLDRLLSFWSVGVLAIVVIVLGIVGQNFYSQSNWVSTTVTSTTVLFVALGQLLVILTGGIDLSVGAIIGFSGMTAAWVMQETYTSPDKASKAMILGLAAGVLTGIVAGALNGVLVTKVKIPPFVATLGSLGVLTGLSAVISDGSEITKVPPQLTSIGNSVLWGWFGTPVIAAIVLVVALWLLLAKTRFGMRTFALGSNRTAAHRAGMNVDRHLIWVYTLSGFSGAVAGLFLLTRFVTANPQTGATENLAAIAAVVIGGASLFGGRGSVSGTVVGALVIGVLATGLVLAGIQPYWQTVLVGSIILLAVYLDQLGDSLRARR
jgi:ribose transport system permease protein